MRQLNPSLLLVSCLLGVIVTESFAYAGQDREQQIAEGLIKDQRSGEVIWLQQGSTKFLGLFTETFLYQRKTAVLLLHGMGAHPDWPYVISPLRWDLPGHHLPVLSIQLPVLNPDDPMAGYGKTKKLAAQRIRIAVDYLHEQGFNQVVLAGYSFGAALGAYYLAIEKKHGVTAFVSISILARQFLNPTMNLKLLLARINVPTLDIYASNDLATVLKQVPDRRLAAHKNGNTNFTQLEIAGSDHTYNEHISDVTRVIVDWIDRLPDTVNEDTVNSSRLNQYPD